MSTRDERLAQFFGGYFHQDWDIDGPTWQHVVKRCVLEVPRHEVVEIRNDLESWFVESIDDASPNLPPAFRCDYAPALDGLTDRQWVQQLVAEFDRLLAELASP